MPPASPSPSPSPAADHPGAVPLLDAAAARAGDEAAVEAGGTWAGLMERASGHLARGVVECAGRGYGLKVAVLVGKGNNGGDGWGAARRLAAHGAVAWVVAVTGLDVAMSVEADANRQRWIDAGGRVSDGLADVETALAWCDVAVDALLGTGISGAPRGEAGEAAAALLRARDAGTLVVACDIPSGVSSDDGSAPDGSVRADLTVTLGGLKRGLLLHPGATHAGRVVVGELGAGYRPPAVDWQALTAAGAAPPPLGAASDKRARGVVLGIAGAVGTAGAAVLTTRGMLAAGGGLVTIAVPQPIQDVVAPVVPPAMSMGLADEDGVLARDAAGQIADAVDGFGAVVAGPGLGHGPGTREVVEVLLGRARRAVLDADALNVFRDDPLALTDHAGDLVLTPHERELARIVPDEPDLDGEDAWSRRVEIVPALAARLGSTIVAKGPGTIVAAPDGRVWVTPTGGPALGTGGTGDVLAGMIGAAVAAADDVPLAVARAVWWHGFAGQLAGAGSADRPASDAVAAAVPIALARTLALARTRPGFPLP